MLGVMTQEQLTEWEQRQRELEAETARLKAETDTILLGIARGDPAIWGATTTELEQSFDSACSAVEAGSLQGQQLLEALRLIDVLVPLLQARQAQRRYCGRGGVCT